MKVTYENVPLGDGTVTMRVAQSEWELALAPGGSREGSSPVTLRGHTPFHLRRLLAQLGAALDIAGFPEDLDPTADS